MIVTEAASPNQRLRETRETRGRLGVRPGDSGSRETRGQTDLEFLGEKILNRSDPEKWFSILGLEREKHHELVRTDSASLRPEVLSSDTASLT